MIVIYHALSAYQIVNLLNISSSSSFFWWDAKSEICCLQFKETRSAHGGEDITRNPCFEDGLNGWSGRGCKILLHSSLGDGKITPLHGRFFASATDRRQSWNGIQQDITGRVRRKISYEVTALVRILGSANATLRSTLWVQAPSGREEYISISRWASIEVTCKLLL